jgi:diguanylate cyclase (GGDEF)-like protein
MKKSGAVKPVELLRQNLAIEPDLQNFIGFVLESVNKLGGSPFTASIALLELMQRLRGAGAGTGYPLPVSLWLHGNQVLVRWEEGVEHHAPQVDSDPPRARVRAESYAAVANLDHAPLAETVAQLCQHLLNSTESADPAILLQRNAEMARHLDETRARTEKELKALQQALETRQNELHESLRAAETDPLTGLLNRRAFDERLGQAFRRAMRQKNEPLSLVLLDLDYFKQINDEYGHQFGDSYLNNMAHVLRSIVREDVDFAFRFGGDEFALVVFADYPLACTKARQVLQMMDNKVSIGITAINRSVSDDLTLEQFIHHADTALYEAKRTGRGRTVVDLCPMRDSSDCGFPCPDLGGADGGQ